MKRSLPNFAIRIILSYPFCYRHLVLSNNIRDIWHFIGVYIITNKENPMHMIWHNYTLIHHNLWIKFWNFQQKFFCYFPTLAQSIIFPKNTISIMGTDRHKIIVMGRIIISGNSCMFSFRKFHRKTILPFLLCSLTVTGGALPLPYIMPSVFSTGPRPSRRSGYSWDSPRGLLPNDSGPHASWSAAEALPRGRCSARASCRT